jgi:hypothetical protein
LNEEKKKAKEDKNKAREQVEHEKEGEKGKEKEGEEGKGQEGEEGKGQQGEDGKGQEGEEQTAAAPAAERAGQDQEGKEQTAAAPAAEGAAKVDNDGRHLAAGDTVICYSSKKKDRYNERKAQVDRLNSKHAMLTMLEGPAKGEKRKADYNSLKVCPRTQSAKKLFASGASSASVAPGDTLAGPLGPDDNCREMFGDLNMME